MPTSAEVIRDVLADFFGGWHRMRMASSPGIAPQGKDLIGIGITQRFNAQRPVVPVSGAWGGINGEGLVVAHLYTEYSDIPTEGVIYVDPVGGQIVRQDIPVRNRHLIREINATLAMTADSAEALGKWLIEHSEKAKAARAGKA